LSLAESTFQRREMESHARKDRRKEVAFCVTKTLLYTSLLGRMIYTAGSRKRGPVIAKRHHIVLG